MRQMAAIAGRWHSYTRSAMPIYEYRCDRGHTFEVLRKMSDEPLAACLTCEAPVEQIFYPIAIHFKGSGFYNTDYGTKKRSREQESKNREAKSDAKASETKSAEGKSESKSGEGKAPEAKASKPEKSAVSSTKKSKD